MLQGGCYELLQFIGWSKLAKYDTIYIYLLIYFTVNVICNQAVKTNQYNATLQHECRLFVHLWVCRPSINHRGL